ncbi:MAG: hypothetical protein PHE70_05150 [Tepidanaerobacteraceae bacterium]|nr:hypothetical protein [Tepidanaerobacteraceae bacterium]
MNKDTIVEKLKEYTSSKEKIIFAFLFESLARDKARNKRRFGHISISYL